MQNLILFIAFFCSFKAQAYKERSYYVGLTPVAFGIFDKVTTQASAEYDKLGTIEYLPLSIGGTWSVYSNWYFNPQLTTTLLVPTNTGNGYTRSFYNLFFKFGKNFGSSGSSGRRTSSENRSSSSGGWDWNLAPGLFSEELKGNGGTFTDPNGAVGYYPTGSSNVKLYTLSGGFGYEEGKLRFSSDLVLFNAFNTDKRTMNIYLTIAWLGNL